MTIVTPATNTAIPKCATCMPSQLSGWASSPVRVARIRSTIPLTTAVAIQVANARLSATNTDQRPNMKGATIPTTTATAAGTYRCFTKALILADFQLATGPTAISSSAGTIRGTQTVLKYGGPTESLPNPSASDRKSKRLNSSH